MLTITIIIYLTHIAYLYSPDFDRDVDIYKNNKRRNQVDIHKKPAWKVLTASSAVLAVLFVAHKKVKTVRKARFFTQRAAIAVVCLTFLYILY